MRNVQGSLYLTTIINLYDRQVIGWALISNLSTKRTIIPDWRMVLSKRHIIKPLISHSDKDVQYVHNLFIKHLKNNKLITQSMSRKGIIGIILLKNLFSKILKLN